MHAKFASLLLDQGFQIVISPRSPANVPEPIGAPSDGILHWSDCCLLRQLIFCGDAAVHYRIILHVGGCLHYFWGYSAVPSTLKAFQLLKNERKLYISNRFNKPWYFFLFFKKFSCMMRSTSEEIVPFFNGRLGWWTRHFLKTCICTKIAILCSA